VTAGLVRIGLVCIVFLVAACSSSSKNTAPASSTTTTTTASLPSTASPDALVFREVITTLPFDDLTSPSTPAGSTPSSSTQLTSCNGGALVTPSNEDTLASPQVILPDREQAVCYVLGPVLLAPRNIAEATAVEDPAGGWSVSVHFSNDDFVQKIGRAMVGKTIAIVFHHIVQSAPRVNEGITEPAVSISGNFDEKTARELANALR
jgi:preprotein translocase subunit SecD